MITAIATWHRPLACHAALYLFLRDVCGGDFISWIDDTCVFLGVDGVT
ncbi:MAG: hypothetical protein WCC90_11380 [Methylocella sp.]